MLRTLAVMAFTIFVLPGCATKTGTGVLVGSGVGAGTGALIGKAAGNTGAGALLGTAVGGIAGGLIGDDMDRQDKRTTDNHLRQAEGRIQELESRPANAPLGLVDVVGFIQKGWSDDLILQTLHDSHSTFQLSPADKQWLKDNGASDKLVMSMARMAPVAAAPQYVRGRPVVYHAAPPVYVVEPAPVVVPWGPPPPPFYRPRPPGFGMGVYWR